MKKTFDTEKKLYTLSLLVQDIPGVLSQVARLFSRKGYNIESIVSGETSQPGVTRITIVILGDELMVNQIAAQCRKLIPVMVVKILDEETSIQREFAMIKVKAVDRNARDEVIQMANIFRANIIDVSRETLTVAIFGDKNKTSALIDLLDDFGILEMAKTGTLAIERGRSSIYDDNKLREEYNYGKTYCNVNSTGRTVCLKLEYILFIKRSVRSWLRCIMPRTVTSTISTGRRSLLSATVPRVTLMP